MTENETAQAVETVERTDAGFEFRGRFYPWHVTDSGKDLLIIDRIAAMPVDEFFELVEEGDDEKIRGSVLLALIATSLKAGNPGWSVERVVRTVMDLSLGDDVVMMGGDEEEQPVPPAPAGAEPPASSSPADASSSSQTPQDS